MINVSEALKTNISVLDGLNFGFPAMSSIYCKAYSSIRLYTSFQCKLLV